MAERVPVTVSSGGTGAPVPVYLSYCEEDNVAAEYLKQCLSTLGFCFVDDVTSAQAMLVLMTHSYAASPSCLAAYRFAADFWYTRQRDISSIVWACMIPQHEADESHAIRELNFHVLSRVYLPFGLESLTNAAMKAIAHKLRAKPYSERQCPRKTSLCLFFAVIPGLFGILGIILGILPYWGCGLGPAVIIRKQITNLEMYEWHCLLDGTVHVLQCPDDPTLGNHTCTSWVADAGAELAPLQSVVPWYLQPSNISRMLGHENLDAISYISHAFAYVCSAVCISPVLIIVSLYSCWFGPKVRCFTCARVANRCGGQMLLGAFLLLGGSIATGVCGYIPSEAHISAPIQNWTETWSNRTGISGAEITVRVPSSEAFTAIAIFTSVILVGMLCAAACGASTVVCVPRKHARFGNVPMRPGKHLGLVSQLPQLASRPDSKQNARSAQVVAHTNPLLVSVASPLPLTATHPVFTEQITTKPRYCVFLSHQWDTKPVVNAVAAALQAQGFDVWLDTSDMVPGDAMFKEIADGMANSDVFLAFVSTLYLERMNCRKEFGLALHRRMRIVVLAVEADCWKRKPNVTAAPPFANDIEWRLPRLDFENVAAAATQAIKNNAQFRLSEEEASRLARVIHRAAGAADPIACSGMVRGRQVVTGTVYICHCMRNAAEASCLAKLLQLQGVPVQMLTEAEAAAYHTDSGWRTVESKIACADVVFVLVTNSMLNDKQCHAEMRLVTAERKRVVALRLLSEPGRGPNLPPALPEETTWPPQHPIFGPIFSGTLYINVTALIYDLSRGAPLTDGRGPAQEMLAAASFSRRMMVKARTDGSERSCNCNGGRSGGCCPHSSRTYFLNLLYFLVFVFVGVGGLLVPYDALQSAATLGSSIQADVAT